MKKEKLSRHGLLALNDIYIVEEEPVETSYDTGLKPEVTDALKSGKLFIPDAYKDFAEKYPCQGTIISKGPQCRYASVGDRVIYARLGVQRYQLNGRMLCSVREADIHGIIQS